MTQCLLTTVLHLQARLEISTVVGMTELQASGHWLAAVCTAVPALHQRFYCMTCCRHCTHCVERLAIPQASMTMHIIVFVKKVNTMQLIFRHEYNLLWLLSHLPCCRNAWILLAATTSLLWQTDHG